MTSSTRPLVIGQISLSFHVASAAIVRRVLAQANVDHAVVEHPHERIFEMLGQGDIDLVVSAWLPGSHGAYVAPHRDELLELGVLYELHAISRDGLDPLDAARRWMSAHPGEVRAWG